MAVEPVLSRIRQARELGHRKITLLGGEPTLQPGFMSIIRETVALGFEEIVLFTNGVKTARAEFVDAILATGGRFTWRISIQGASRETHERTTKKPGSFGRIERTLAHLAERGERITVNMCVVTSNFEDVDQFPDLLLPYGTDQLHLDMMRPLDAGERTEEELRATLPRYSDLAPPLRRMIAGFPDDFDVNVGNLPYCIAPDLSPWIHHDGEHTDTIAIDGDDRLSQPWNKYLVKRRDKFKPESCRGCVMHDGCSGVFETYARFHGTDELRSIDASMLRDADPGGRLFGVWGPRLLGEGFTVRTLSERSFELEREGVRLRLDAVDHEGIARYARFGVHALASGDAPEAHLFIAEALKRLDPPVHPYAAALPARLRAPIARLRARAPFGGLRWTRLGFRDGRAQLEFEALGATVHLWIGVDEGRPAGGYRIDGEASDAVVEGLRAVMKELRAPSARVAERAR